MILYNNNNFNVLKKTSNHNNKTSTVNNFKSQSKVGVIDDFIDNEDFDNDGIKDKTSHGEIVSSFVGTKNIIKLQYNNNETVASKLENLRKRAEKGENIGAINLSLGCEMSYDELSHGAEEKITPANIKQKAPKIIAGMREEMKTFPQARTEIATDLKSLQMQLNSLPPGSLQAKEINTKIDDLNWTLSTFNKIEDTVNTHDEIDKLAKLGVPVVISSGNISENDLNNGIERFNLLTLNEKAITVGSTSPNTGTDNHQISFFSNYNSLVDINIQGIHNTNFLPDELSNKMSFTGTKNYQNSLKGFTTGTSFSAPQIAKYASQLHDKGASVGEMNNFFNAIDQVAETKNLKTSFLLGNLVNNYNQ